MTIIFLLNIINFLYYNVSCSSSRLNRHNDAGIGGKHRSTDDLVRYCVALGLADYNLLYNIVLGKKSSGLAE